MDSRPSMTALLAVLAVAGYQHRDKLASLLGGLTGGGASAPADVAGRRGGQLSRNPTPAAADESVGGMLTNGIKELVDRFRQSGHGEEADSWVASGPNKPVQPTHLENALGDDTLTSIARQTGLSREEILARLTRDLPGAVDRYTPDGRLPSA